MAEHWGHVFIITRQGTKWSVAEHNCDNLAFIQSMDPLFHCFFSWLPLHCPIKLAKPNNHKSNNYNTKKFQNNQFSQMMYSVLFYLVVKLKVNTSDLSVIFPNRTKNRIQSGNCDIINVNLDFYTNINKMTFNYIHSRKFEHLHFDNIRINHLNAE